MAPLRSNCRVGSRVVWSKTVSTTRGAGSAVAVGVAVALAVAPDVALDVAPVLGSGAAEPVVHAAADTRARAPMAAATVGRTRRRANGLPSGVPGHEPDLDCSGHRHRAGRWSGSSSTRR